MHFFPSPKISPLIIPDFHFFSFFSYFQPVCMSRQVITHSILQLLSEYYVDPNIRAEDRGEPAAGKDGEDEEATVTGNKVVN